MKHVGMKPLKSTGFLRTVAIVGDTFSNGKLAQRVIGPTPNVRKSPKRFPAVLCGHKAGRVLE